MPACVCPLSPAFTTPCCCGPLCYPGFYFGIFLCAVALPALGAQYPVFSPTPAPKLMEDGKVHTVEHLINPLAIQHPEHTTAAAATVLPAVSTPPPFQVSLTESCCLGEGYYSYCSLLKILITKKLLQKRGWLAPLLIPLLPCL